MKSPRKRRGSRTPTAESRSESEPAPAAAETFEQPQAGTTLSIELLDRERVPEFVAQEARRIHGYKPSPKKEDEAARGILGWTYVYLVRWSQSDVPPIRVSGRQAAKFLGERFPLGPFLSDCLVDEAEEHLVDTVGLVEEEVENVTVFRCLVLTSDGGEVEPFTRPADRTPAGQGSASVEETGLQSPTPTSPPVGGSSAHVTRSTTVGSPPTPAANGPRPGPVTQSVSSPSVTPIAHPEALALLQEVESFFGPGLDDCRAVVGGAESLVLLSYVGPVPTGIDVFGRKLGSIDEMFARDDHKAVIGQVVPLPPTRGCSRKLTRYIVCK